MLLHERYISAISGVCYADWLENGQAANVAASRFVVKQFLIGEQTGDETSIKEKAKVRSSLLGKKTKQCMCSRHS